MRRGQVSTEIIIIIGFVVAMMLPLLFAVYSQELQSNQSLGLSQANLAASRLGYVIDSVGTLGSNSSMVVQLNLPEVLQSIGTGSGGGQKELIFQLKDTGQGGMQIVKMTRFNLTIDSQIQNLSRGGTYYVNVRSDETVHGVRVSLYTFGK